MVRSRAQGVRNKRRKRSRQTERLNELNFLEDRFDKMTVRDGGVKPGRAVGEAREGAADPHVQEFLKAHPIPGLDIDPEDWCFVKPCVPVQMAHLRHYNREPKVWTNEAEVAWEKGFSIVSEILELEEKLEFPIVEDLQKVRFKRSKYPGLFYREQGYRDRGDAHDVALGHAEKKLRRIQAGQVVKPHKVRLGGRGKISERRGRGPEAEVPAVGRMILMFSHRDLLLCGITENLLTRAYAPYKYPIAVGSSWFYGGTEAFLRTLLGYVKYLCFDAKKFDSSIDPRMVDGAILLLRRQFRDGMNPVYDAYWNFIRESTLNTIIQRDDGFEFERGVGTTSGHSHNTLIQSVITLILMYAGFALLEPQLTAAQLKSFITGWSLGDDNVAAVRGGLERYTVEDVSWIVWEEFGIDWSGQKSFATTRLADEIEGDFEGVQFLGKYFRQHFLEIDGSLSGVMIPYRPARETLLRLYYPEHGSLSVGASYLRALGNYLDAAGNSTMESWLREYIEWLLQRMEVVPQVWPDNYLRMVTRDYSHAFQDPPPPRLLTRGEWFEIVVNPPDRKRYVSQ